MNTDTMDTNAVNTKTDAVYWSEFELDDMRLLLAATQTGVCRIALPNETFEDFRRWVEAHTQGARMIPDDQRLADCRQQLQQYFEGQRQTFQLKLNLRGTPFQTAVWRALGEIPFGEVRSYSDVAQAVGRVRAVRAVAAANGQNPVPIVLPCHRVIGKNGTLTGFRGGLRLKQRLLQLEGVDYVNGWGHARFNF